MQKSTKYKLSIWIAILVAISYFFIPFDIFPDAVPVMGWIDDIIVILMAVTNGLVLGSKLRKNK
jgi:uncharacterized membrane protein YkvA (DUF1232 family)